MADRPPDPASPRYPASDASPLVDAYGRTIRYLRVSVTDRCDFRCVYCMSEDTSFVPRSEVLSLEELERVCSAFVMLGVRKLRLTGGEPLVRRGFLSLVRGLSRHLDSGMLDELSLTTNGSQLARHAADLAGLGVRRVNVSLDTLDPERFRRITRWGRLERVQEGLAAAAAAGLAVKLNCVALKGVNEDEFDRLIGWCGERGFDLTLIEVMPLGDIDGAGGFSRAAQFLPLTLVRERLARRWTLEPIDYQSGGPSRYVRVRETGGRLGFITPLSESFCQSCNRVRLTATGTLTLCLGRSEAVELRPLVRGHPDSDQPLLAALRAAIRRKPDAHGFGTTACPALAAAGRLMNLTGG
ncbi:MAG: GTP 3',8-cyclase MoaA [Rhodospirillaceae bacterium]